MLARAENFSHASLISAEGLILVLIAFAIELPAIRAGRDRLGTKALNYGETLVC